MHMGSHFSPLCHRRQCQSQVHIEHDAENQKQKTTIWGQYSCSCPFCFVPPAACEACQTTERCAYKEATWVASSTTNPRPITVWNLDGLHRSISRHNTRGRCGPLWKIDPVLVSGTTCSSSIH